MSSEPGQKDSTGYATPCNSRVASAGSELVNVMAFTATYNRPEMALMCALQMERQTIRPHHFVFVNGEPDYSGLLNRFSASDVESGKRYHQHYNHINAINIAKLDKYDLFLKIDDDDFYGRTYVENTVNSWLKHGWDFSGGYSDGVLVDGVYKTIKIDSLGATEKDRELGINMAMPSTYAFSRKAIDVILSLDPSIKTWEDQQWRWALHEAGMQCFIRDTAGFSYNKHSSNTSRPTVGRRRVRFSALSSQ